MNVFGQNKNFRFLTPLDPPSGALTQTPPGGRGLAQTPPFGWGQARIPTSSGPERLRVASMKNFSDGFPIKIDVRESILVGFRALRGH